MYAFSLPTKADKTGADWLHEIKYDGYRMMVVRDPGPRAAHQPRRL
jgi:ATP-dependent DNA ligase